MKNTSVFLVLIILFIFTRCDEQEGDTPRMKWSPSVKTKKGISTTISVPSNGGTYTFRCKNYNTLWIASVCEDGKYKHPEDYYNYVSEDWVNIKLIKDNMTVVLSQNKRNVNRTIEVNISVGNTGTIFIFNQEH